MLTRWGTWVDAVTYLSEYLDMLKEFLSSEGVVSAAASFKELKSLLDTNFCCLKSQALFIQNHGGKIVSTLKSLESKAVPLAHILFSTITTI